MEAAPIEVALVVEPAFERPSDNEATRRWCGQLLDMYRAWADNRHMQLSEIAGATAARSAVAAHQRLRRPSPAGAGDRPARAGAGGRGRAAHAGRRRGCGSPSRRWAICRPTSSAARSTDALGRGPQPHAVVRRYRSEPSPLVRNMNGSWRTRQARRRAARRLRPDRRQPGVGAFFHHRREPPIPTASGSGRGADACSGRLGIRPSPHPRFPTEEWREGKGSDVGVLGVVGVQPICGAQALVELGDVQENLLPMDGGNRAERHSVLAGILDDRSPSLRPAVRRDLADGRRRACPVSDGKHLESFFDRTTCGHAGLHNFEIVLLPPSDNAEWA